MKGRVLGLLAGAAIVLSGLASDTYWPTVDATNVHTLQYLVTDGSTFTDLQTRT